MASAVRTCGPGISEISVSEHASVKAIGGRSAAPHLRRHSGIYSSVL